MLVSFVNCSQLILFKVGDKLKNSNEELLNAWLKVSTCIVNSRVVSELPYNEALVCNLLYQNYYEDNSCPLTATDLCVKTNMMKSQMNRTLNLLENKNIIERKRSDKDRRQVLIFFKPEQANPYNIQHQRILQLLDKIIEQLGENKTKDVINTLTYVSEVANNILNKDNEE